MLVRPSGGWSWVVGMGGLGITLCLLLANLGQVQLLTTKTEPPGDRLIHCYLSREVSLLARNYLDGSNSLAQWTGKRQRLRREFLDMMGLDPLPEKTPLKATVTRLVRRGKLVIENLHFQSKPGLYVTANLYRTNNQVRKHPALLILCGHDDQGRNGNKTSVQRQARWFASHGYVCLVLDTLQLGEIPGLHHGTFRGQRWWWQARGYTPAGVECWNAIRSVDYLVSRPEVDSTRLGVTGASGGGATSIWLAAADERVQVVAAVSAIGDLESYVIGKTITRLCDCTFPINTYQWEPTTIAALIAPRPLLFANSDLDYFFPVDGHRRICARLEKIYKLYGQGNEYRGYLSVGGHEDRADLRLATYQWFQRHLCHDTRPVNDDRYDLLGGAELRVFPARPDVPANAINAKVDEDFVPKAKVNLPMPGQFAIWKNNLIEAMRARCFRWFPKRIPPAEVANASALGNDGLARQMLNTERGIKIPLYLAVTDAVADSRNIVVVLMPSETEIGRKPPAWTDQWTRNHTTYLLPLRGQTFETQWTRKPPFLVERSHALIGKTVDETRVWDVAAIARHLQRSNPGKSGITVVGRGQTGIIGAYAAIFEPAINHVVVIDPPHSHVNGPIFLNILRALDIPEALGLLAPNQLTLVNAKNKSFERTRKIYHAAGKGNKLRLQ